MNASRPALRAVARQADDRAPRARDHRGGRVEAEPRSPRARRSRRSVARADPRLPRRPLQRGGHEGPLLRGDREADAEGRLRQALLQGCVLRGARYSVYGSPRPRGSTGSTAGRAVSARRAVVGGREGVADLVERHRRPRQAVRARGTARSSGAGPGARSPGSRTQGCLQTRRRGRRRATRSAAPATRRAPQMAAARRMRECERQYTTRCRGARPRY